MANAEKKTLHDIAEFIRAPKPVENPVSPDEGKTDHQEREQDDQTEAELEEHDDVEEAEEAYASDDLDDTDTSETEEHDESDDGNDDDALGYTDDDGFVHVNDDDMIEVKIDGEVVMRSIADAKKALSGEGAIDKRLKEATEARKRALADHTQLLDQFRMAQQNMQRILGNLDGVLFQPAVEKPPASLRQSNPQQYLAQLEAYEADQQRLNEGRQQVKKLINEQNQAMQRDIQEYQQQQAQALVESIPSLGEPQKAQTIMQEMAKLAIEDYGFSPEEVKVASDHRLYRMMHDLLVLREARKRGDTDAVKKALDVSDQPNKRPRKLRSGATQLKHKQRAKAKQQQKTSQRARQTGRVKDVAATLIQKG